MSDSCGSQQRGVGDDQSRGRNVVRKLIRRILATSEQQRSRIMMALALLVMFSIGSLGSSRLRKKMLHNDNRSGYSGAADAPISMLLELLDRGSIDRAMLGSSIIFYLSGGKWRKSRLPRNNKVQHDILESVMKSKGELSALPESLSSKLVSAALPVIPFLYLYGLYRLLQNMYGTSNIAKEVTCANSKASFCDIAGQEAAVLEVAEVVNFLRNPSAYYRVGARAPRGVLLYGPPGSGKTLIARAVAGEAAVDAFYVCSASDFVEMYVGRGAARVRHLFGTLRRQARGHGKPLYLRWLPTVFGLDCDEDNSSTSTAILFIDELDALAKCRSSFGTNDEREQTLNQLLTEMDGFAQDDDVTLVVMAATNRADILDPAILRRFDRQIHVGQPDASGRRDILAIHTRSVQVSDSIDWTYLASDDVTDDFSGADLQNMVNDAAILAVRAGSPLVSQCHLEHAASRSRKAKTGIVSLSFSELS